MPLGGNAVKIANLNVVRYYCGRWDGSVAAAETISLDCIPTPDIPDDDFFVVIVHSTKTKLTALGLGEIKVFANEFFLFYVSRN